ncbi:MAG: solute:sodium symporter family transporter, partial [Bacteroidota bacterium]
IPYFGLQYIGDGDMFAGISKLVNEHPEKFNAIGDSDAEIPFATIFTGMMLVQLFYWGTNQAIIQRALGAKNLKEGQKGLLLASFVKILGPLIVVVPGIIAFHIFQGSITDTDLVYPQLVVKVLPASLVGFFAAVIFGAILSSFNSALNSSVTLFGVDIYKEFIKKEASEQEVVKVGKYFGIVLALLAMCVAPFIANASDGLFAYLQEVNGCYSIPILTIIVVGFTTKYVPAKAANIAIILGALLYIISQFVLQPYVFGKENYLHYLHVMAILFVLNIGIMLLIGKLSPREAAYEQQYTREVDITNWKYATPVGILVILLVIGTYIIFS